MPNIGGWYRRKWKAYTPTDEESKFSFFDWFILIVFLFLIFTVLYSLVNL